MQNKFHITILLILLHSSLFANSFLTDYRINGIKNIEKKMDKKLAQTEYWNRYLKNLDTQFGYIKSFETILTCNKKTSTLNVYFKKEDNAFKLKKEYSAYTGKNKGDKFIEGDLKTPVGLYNLTKKISNVDPFYGPLALVTSYPNTYDKYKGKNGHGIWIHGLPTDQKRDTFTKGCIALQNPSMECLNKNIDITKTLLIISEKRVKKNVSKKVLSTILAQLFEWRYSWIYNNVENYLNFYSNKFIRYDGLTHDGFVTYKRRIFKKQEAKTIIFTKLNVIPYPDSSDLYKISFNEFYQSKSFTFTGSKILIVKLQNNKIKILTEK